MTSITAQLQALVDVPHETLNIEVKRWLDLSSKADQAVLAKAAIALANHGGGFIVLGFEEAGDGSFHCHSPRPDTLEAYHPDAISRIVATYAEPAFQVVVTHIVREGGGAFPVVQVPGGHRTPVMTKKGSPDQKTLVAGRVYIRRPTPESAEPGTAVEWRELFDRCVRAARDDLLDAMRGILDGRVDISIDATPSSLDRLNAWTDAGLTRWRALAPESQAGQTVDPPGFYVVSYQIEGVIPKRPMTELLATLSGIPGLTGWRPWWVPSRDGIRPYLFDGCIECYHGAEGNVRVTDPAHADFWRANDQGQMLIVRGFDEDSIPERVVPGTAFDISMPVWRIGECLAHAGHLVERLAGEPRTVTFSTRWFGLRGRKLVHLQGRRLVHPGQVAKQDSFEATLSVGSEVVSDQLPELLYEMLQPLYALFDFCELSKRMVNEEVHRLRSR